jgi:hypothetical protein
MLNDTKIDSLIGSDNCIDVIVNIDGDTEVYRGVLILASSNFILIQSIEELDDDGFVIFPVRTIDRIERSDIHEDIDRILSCIGFKYRKAPQSIAIDNWQNIFRYIQGRNILCGLTYEDGDLEVGIIVDISGNDVTLRGIDGGGNFLVEPVIMPYHGIVAVWLERKYINALQKYISIGKGSSSDKRMN